MANKIQNFQFEYTRAKFFAFVLVGSTLGAITLMIIGIKHFDIDGGAFVLFTLGGMLASIFLFTPFAKKQAHVSLSDSRIKLDLDGKIYNIDFQGISDYKTGIIGYTRLKIEYANRHLIVFVNDAITTPGPAIRCFEAFDECLMKYIKQHKLLLRPSKPILIRPLATVLLVALSLTALTTVIDGISKGNDVGDLAEATLALPFMWVVYFFERSRHTSRLRNLAKQTPV